MGETKIRKQIYIDPEQESKLKKLAARLQTSEAELIRHAIDEHISAIRLQRRNMQAWDEEMAFILERSRKSTVTGKRNWQREDLYDR
ncbi:MAG: CopG family transcriptional regulator [Caldilineaceae bacterium]